MVEVRTEKLVYDLLGVFAAAGGNLGLCLGFSCLTLLFSLLNWIKERGYFWWGIIYRCCIFQPLFGCCAVQALIQICYFNILVVISSSSTSLNKFFAKFCLNFFASIYFCSAFCKKRWKSILGSAILTVVYFYKQGWLSNNSCSPVIWRKDLLNQTPASNLQSWSSKDGWHVNKVGVPHKIMGHQTGG